MKRELGKRDWAFLLCAFAFLPVSAQEKQAYTVMGEVNDSAADGRMIYIERYDDHKMLDSTRISDGKFVFSGFTDRPWFCCIQATDREHANIVLEGGDIRASVGRTVYNKPSGTPLNDEIHRIDDIIDSLYAVYSPKMEALKAQGLDSAAYRKARISLAGSYNADVRRITEGLFSRHPDDAVTEKLLRSEFYQTQTLDDRERIMASLGPWMKTTNIYKYLSQRLKAERRTSVGQMFVDINGRDVSGKPVRLSDYVGRGNYVLVDFWASWCRPCHEEIPNLARLHREFKDKGLTVLGLFTWDDEKLMGKTARKLGAVWPQMFDAERKALELYGADGIPLIILFGPDGRIVERGLRGEGMVTKVTEIMNKHNKGL